jgi:outer membrane protein OmpA-like peptidoglycan-associated protein
MKRISLAALVVALGCASAQSLPPNSRVITRTIYAFGYEVGGGSTKVDFEASSLAPGAKAEAKVEAKKGVTNIEINVKDLPPSTKLGSGLLTYVVWAVSPDGRTINVGECQLNNSGDCQLKATTELQAFSLFVTAEPYYAVRLPSEAVVLANIQKKGSKFRMYPIKDYALLKRAQYENPTIPVNMTPDKNTPPEMYQARNAVAIAHAMGAEKYAPEVYSKADGGIKLSEAAIARKKDKKEVISLARQTIQSAEDARELTIRKQDEERVAMERQAAADKAKAEAEAKAATEQAELKRKAEAEQAELKRKAEAEQAELKRKADEEARRQAEIAAANEARMKAEAADAKRKADEEARRQAEIAAANEARLKAEAEAKEARMKAEADAAAMKAKMEADALKAKEEAAKAEADRQRKEKEALRAQLLDQLNKILETKDSVRGLVVTMADVLFDTGKYNIKPTTREKLARLAGIVLAHPGLKLEIEGHTDSTGSDEINQKLSEKRAETVRTFLTEQGLAADAITAKGFGKTMPVADNATAAGRQKNRRVEIVVSGEVIGIKLNGDN